MIKHNFLLSHLDNCKSSAFQCYEYAISKLNSKLFFLIISRDGNCLKGVSQKLVLNVLPKDEAEIFVENELKNRRHTFDRNDVKKLAKGLKCFPIAMQTAVESIDGSYSIKDCITDVEKRLRSALKITLETIQKRGSDGEAAIKILEKMVPNENNEVKPKMLLPQFNNDLKILSIGIRMLKSYSIITEVSNGVFKVNSLFLVMVGLDIARMLQNLSL